MIPKPEARTLRDFLQSGGLGWLTREVFQRGVDQELLSDLSTRYPNLSASAFNTAVDRAVRNAGAQARLEAIGGDTVPGRLAHEVDPLIPKNYYYLARTTGQWVDSAGTRHDYTIDFGVNSDTPLTLNQIESEVSARLSDSINPLSGTQGVGSIAGTPNITLFRAERRS